MKRILYFLACIALVSCGSTSKCPVKDVQSTSKAMPVIMETDIGNDVDDALAMDLLYKYMDAGKIDLLAVNINKEGIAPAEYVDILNTWYGYPDIPIGIIKGGADCENDAVNYAKAVTLEKTSSGEPLFGRSHPGYADYPSAVELYRKILSTQKDNSVTIISVGFSTNLVRLLATGPDKYSKLDGKALVAKKVKLLSMMAGDFADPNFHEYNVVKDIPAAKTIFEQWPTPVVTSPFEVGIAITYPSSSIENDFRWAVPAHPVVEAYKAYKPMPYDRPTWDPTATLFALGETGLFTVSELGRINVTGQGSTIFTPDPKGTRRYLSVTPSQAAQVKAFLVKKISSKPEKYFE